MAKPAAADERANESFPAPPRAPPARAAPAGDPSTESVSAGESKTFGLISLLRADERAAPRPAVTMNADEVPRQRLAPSIWAETIDDAASAGGLRLSSTGVSGGKASGGERVAVATVGKGKDDLDVTAFDHGNGALGERRFRQNVKDPDGHLPSELIQRVVRDNFGRFESCYQGGLRKNPALRGRVIVRFVIDRHGAVALARDSGSDLTDSDVTACVVRAFDTLVFPESKDSSVTIVYPLVFTP